MNFTSKRLPWVAADVYPGRPDCRGEPAAGRRQIDLSRFRSLPVVRTRPGQAVDTAVRTALRTITGKESVTTTPKRMTRAKSKSGNFRRTSGTWRSPAAKLEDSRAWGLQVRPCRQRSSAEPTPS